MTEAQKPAPALRRNQKTPPAAKRGDGLRRAANKARESATPSKSYAFQVKPPTIMAGVVPVGFVAPVLAMDANPYAFAADVFPGGGFPGFSYLSQLATRAEFRAFASTLSTELTREWLEFTSKQDDDTDTSEKIKMIEDEFKRLNIRGVIQKAAEHDSYFGRGQLFIEIDGADRKTPLILDPRTIKKGSLARVVPVEAVWTTPAGYNALDPAAPDFYQPSSWFMLGQQVHASRPHRASAPTALLSSLEADIVSRINAQRGARGLRPLRVSRGLTKAASYHCRQMGLFGFFEHESRNGAAFWRRIERFYPPRRGYWSVGENILWESPDASGPSAVREWMHSPPHRENILTREWREVGVAAVHFAAAHGAFGGRPVTIVTADFGVRR